MTPCTMKTIKNNIINAKHFTKGVGIDFSVSAVTRSQYFSFIFLDNSCALLHLILWEWLQIKNMDQQCLQLTIFSFNFNLQSLVLSQSLKDSKALYGCKNLLSLQLTWAGGPKWGNVPSFYLFGLSKTVYLSFWCQRFDALVQQSFLHLLQ